MKPIGVFFATRQGHAQRVAEHIADTLHARGLETEVRNLRNQSEAVEFDEYTAIVLTASVHFGIHEYEMTKFVKQNRADLEAIPSAFVSVNLTQAAAEKTAATQEQRTNAAAMVDSFLNDFYVKTGWHPQYVKAVAGALAYTKYNFLARFIMKRIAGKNAGDTDTSHDYVYTNWTALDQFVNQFATALQLTDGPCPTSSSARA